MFRILQIPKRILGCTEKLGRASRLAWASSVNTIIARAMLCSDWPLSQSGFLEHDVISLTTCCDSYHSRAYQKRVKIEEQASNRWWTQFLAPLRGTMKNLAETSPGKNKRGRTSQNMRCCLLYSH